MTWAIAPLLACGDIQKTFSIPFRQTKPCWTIQVAQWHISFGNKSVCDCPLPPTKATQSFHSTQRVLPLGSDSFSASQMGILMVPHRCWRSTWSETQICWKDKINRQKNTLPFREQPGTKRFDGWWRCNTQAGESGEESFQKAKSYVKLFVWLMANIDRKK